MPIVLHSEPDERYQRCTRQPIQRGSALFTGEKASLFHLRERQGADDAKEGRDYKQGSFGILGGWIYSFLPAS